MNAFRQIPSIDTLLQVDYISDYLQVYQRDSVIRALRHALDDLREIIRREQLDTLESHLIQQTVMRVLSDHFEPTLRDVINGTGVIIHTNLGRAVLSDDAISAVMAVAQNYSNLEFSLETGKRGSRYTHAEQLLCDLTGAEAALVVNNNAAALVLMLSAIAQGHEVIVSRGQLVEIGGGFRIPDIMRQSGATLAEVGTTNRTRIADYVHAITEHTIGFLRIHSSNFKLVGFTEETPLSQMASAAHEHNLLVMDDLGSGTLIDTAHFGLEHEPMIQESVNAGADLIAFSGDKLLGGPQSGIIIGKADLIQKLKKHPLARAFRADKLCYAALSATLEHYRRDEVFEKIPVWQMISQSAEDIQQIANKWASVLGVEVIAGQSTVGGGSLPGNYLPTHLLSLSVNDAEHFMSALRQLPTPIIGRIADEQVLFDPRTIRPNQYETFLAGVQSVLAGSSA